MNNSFVWIRKSIKKFKKSDLNVVVYSLFLVSVIFYLISLKGCFLSIKECSTSEKIKTYYRLGVCLIISSILFGIIIFVQIIAKLRKINNLIFFLIFFIIFLLTQGTDFAHHGTYNSIIFTLFFPIFSIFSYIIYLILYFCYNYEIKRLLIIFTCCLLFIIFFFSIANCKQFYQGIGGIKLINDKRLNKCFIKKPRICGKNLLSGLFDVNYFRKKGCKGYDGEKEIFLKSLDEKLKNYDTFSFPRTEFMEPNDSYIDLHNMVEKGIKEVNENNSKNTEVFVSFKGGKGKIKIMLKKNETLIKKKRKLSKRYNTKFNNVYMIFFDAISRNHFNRKFKKSTKLLEKMLYSNKKKEDFYNNYNAFQFFKYHSVDGHTEGNIFPIFFGNNRDSKKGISLVKFFNEKGFITASTHNSCVKEIFEWITISENFTFSHYDHENVAMFCDTNYEDKNDRWAIINGRNSIFRRCFYGRDSFEYNFEYILQFLKTYKNEKKFFRISIEDGHEPTTEVIKYIDDSFSAFLIKILKYYFDTKTAIIIFSDHGAHLPGPHDFLFYQERKIEKYLGLLLLILPNLYLYNSSNIMFNQQQFITPFDIHATLLDMINVKQYINRKINLNKGQSLFFKINGKIRSCDNYVEEILKKNCFCKNYES